MSYRADQLNREEHDIVVLLDAAQANLEKYSRDWADADATYEEHYAKAFLQSKAKADKVTDKVAEAEATVAASKDRLKTKISEALMKSALSAVRVQMAKLNSWQSKCSNIKAEESATRAPEPDWSPAETVTSGWRCNDPDCSQRHNAQADHSDCTPF